MVLDQFVEIYAPVHCARRVGQINSNGLPHFLEVGIYTYVVEYGITVVHVLHLVTLTFDVYRSVLIVPFGVFLTLRLTTSYRNRKNSTICYYLQYHSIRADLGNYCSQGMNVSFFSKSAPFTLRPGAS